MQQQPNTHSIHLDPAKFYGLVKAIRSVTEGQKTALAEQTNFFEDRLNSILEKRSVLARANENLFQEIRLSTKINPLSSFEDQEFDANRFKHTLSGASFIYIAFNIVNIIYMARKALVDTCYELRPAPILVQSTDFDLSNLDFTKIQQITYEAQLNKSNIETFVIGCNSVLGAQNGIINATANIAMMLDAYYARLQNRHTDEGVKIFKDPVITDVALSIYENIDSHGEIESGKSPDEVSAYSMRKAEVIISAITNKSIFNLVSVPEQLISFIEKELTELWRDAEFILNLFKPVIKTVDGLLGNRTSFASNDDKFQLNIMTIKDLNPHSVVGKENTKLLSSAEKLSIDSKNETLEKLVGLLSKYPVVPIDIIKFVLARKAELRKFFQDENSFYVCTLGGGNAFLGEAPGSLSVIPGSKPNAKLGDIVGSGFGQLKGFIESIEASAQWQPLFMATSPSKSADKSNVLLVGPPGCGKSEALRCVGAESNSIGVYLQGSDLNTCWKGESAKNPKRLFEGAIKLRRDSKKHVHILIDEIDSILKKKEHLHYGEDDLTLEFQMLMDGVVEYPGITVWGTTNFPERIPTAMLRRFNLLLICGELNLDDRVNLLKQFCGFMPIANNYKDNIWKAQAEKLDGATGDVVRKVVDHVWRFKITDFVKKNAKEAANLTDYLVQETGTRDFDIKKFDHKMRLGFQNKLRPFVTLSPGDLDESISLHLKNVGVHHEIQQAKKTYAEAKEFLARLESGQ